MRLSAIVAAAACLLTAPAFAAPAGDALAGKWIANTEIAADACGSQGGATIALSFEFAVTGGILNYDDGSDSAGVHKIDSVTDANGVVTVTMNDLGPWRFTRTADGKLRADAPPNGFLAAKGQTFTHCFPAADRSHIKLSNEDVIYLTADFRDARRGCTAQEYQYLTIDLVGPVGFRMGRWNSMAIAEKIAAGHPPAGLDDISNWIVEDAEKTPTGYRLTLTELIPPNGSRGDTTTITLNRGGNTITIPEWKRAYVRCGERFGE